MPRILTPVDVLEFRNRLCEVGATLFAEQGFEGFNMRELARRLGVSAMTPYRYFKDKDAIMSEIRTRAFCRFADWLEEQLATDHADENTLSHAYSRFAIQEQMQYRLMFDLVQPPSSTLPALLAQEQRVREAISAHLRRHLEHAMVSSDPELLSSVLWSMLHGATALHLAGKLSSQDFNRALLNAVRLFMDCPAETKEERAQPANGNHQATPCAPWWQPITQAGTPAYEAGI